jgi:two-component system OmpR family response regulator
MRVLLAEDDAETAQFVESGLRGLGHDVTIAIDGPGALRIGSAESFDAIVLDRMLPGLAGLDVLRALRAKAVPAPVLILTALGGVLDRVDGLEAGADDYLVKPFELVELAARLNALGRRPPLADRTTRLQAGDIILDLLRREVLRNGKPVHLQPREFGLLEQLMRQAGQVVTRKMFLERVWGLDFDPQTNIVESHLSRLRAKLRERSGGDPIETVRRAGYRIAADD